ncbi:hypothetical protein ACLIMP_25315 (plasmid) [Novosphingobium aerophilum]|uniref:hypothetical protein n=2 Tax=Sphingomonadales TaxID=204457 RepID=UPI0026EDF90C|nr:hypothetical protein [Sphingobium yanoikuyae]
MELAQRNPKGPARIMIIAAIVIISLILMVLFFAVTVAGGRAHDRQNREAARRADHQPSAGDDHRS